MRSRFAVVATLCLVTACEKAPASATFPELFAVPDGRFLLVSSADTSGGNHDFVEIAKGDSAVLLDVAGPGEVRRLWLTVASRDRDYLRRIAIKMYWEGERNPSVEVPTAASA